MSDKIQPLISWHELHDENIQLRKLIDLNKHDTGGGCSACGRYPIVFRNGDNWMCADCVQETINNLNKTLTEKIEATKIIKDLRDWFRCRLDDDGDYANGLLPIGMLMSADKYLEEKA